MSKSGKSGKIVAAVLAAIIIFSIGGVFAAVRENSGKTGETTEATAGSETTGGESSAGTTASETSSASASSAATSKPAEQKSTTAAAANTGGYYYNYPGVNPAPAEINPDKWYLLLVNIHYYLPKDYKINLVNVINDQKLDARVAPHYVEMYNAAEKVGYKLTPNSGYRSISYQAILFESLFKEYQGDKQTVVLKASKRRQPPGCSEHNAGLAMDLCQINTAFANTPEFKWLSENAANYGFILRYQEDKQEKTGVKFEPWHWRYVGVEDAQAMKENGQCLEEYLNKVS